MSAVNPLQATAQPGAGSAADKRVYEPSMEEILASIRRIIADDQSLPGRGAAPDQVSPADVPQHAEPVPAASPAAPVSDSAASTSGHGGDVRSAAPVELTPTVVHHADLPLAEPPAAQPVQAAQEPAPAPSPQTVAPAPIVPPREDDRLETVASAQAHGSIAAPQFAMPDGPVNDDARSESLSPVAPHAVSPVQAEAEPDAEPEPEPEPFSEPDLYPYDEPIEPPPPQAALPLGHADAGVGLFSAATDSAVGSAFNMLAASRLADNSEELMTLAREMIRPLLRTWIDDNLPSMVERMVRAEIERVARGGR